MVEESVSGARAQPNPSLVTITHVIYALHAFSLLIGILGAATIVGSFLIGWPSVIGVILEPCEAERGPRHLAGRQHFHGSSARFSFGVLWVGLCVLFVVMTLGIGLLVGLGVPLAIVGIWFVYGWPAAGSR